MVVINKTKAVIVLKASGKLPLRLFPGHNNVDETSLKDYIKDNPAAAGHAERNLTVVDKDGLSHESLIEAEKAHEKNEKLNRAAVTIKKINQKLAESQDSIDKKEKIIKQQGNTIQEQGKTIEEQGDLLAKQMKMMEDLQAEMSELKAASAGPSDEVSDADKDKKKK